MAKFSQVLVSIWLCNGVAQEPCKPPSSANCVEPYLASNYGAKEDGNPWNTWKAHHGKVYQSVAAEFYRRQVWTNNTKYMMKTNKENAGFSLGWHAHSDLTDEEFKVFRFGFVQSNTTLVDTLGTTHKGHFRNEGKLSDLPTDWDWSAANTEVVTAVKDQGQCGSCWAHAAAGALEGALAVGNGWTRPLSPQQFVSCAPGNGCAGGNPKRAMDWAKDNFVCSEDSFPETHTDGSCNWNCEQVISQGSIWGTYLIDKYDEGALCSALTQRPIAVIIGADNNFQHYSSGILKGSGTRQNHAVLAVGYGYWNGDGYWKVKNSWGTSWGLDGYILLARNGNENTYSILGSKIQGPVGVFVYGPYNPSMQLTNPEGLKISAPSGGALTRSVSV